MKNITINTGTTKFNTAIEYDTDVNRTAYSRVKHYINNGEAYSYAYDEAGNISRIQSPDGSWVSYTYDALGQLTGETYSNGDTIAYVYDVRGNILSKTSNGSVIEYGYTDSKWKDRLTSYNGTAISYDTIGNPTAWHDGSAMTWRRGRQLATYAKNGVTTVYSYNDDGIRTSKTVGTVTTTYNVVDGTLRRLTTSDGNTLQFINGTSVIYNEIEYWYVFNAQGDVIGLIDASGNYVVEYTYDSWGKLLSKTGTLADTLGTINPFRYRGYIYDEESGFYYVSSRYYDPEVGRWLNGDGEVAGVGGDARGYNVFAYCFNNPVNMDDPSGNWPKWLTGAINIVSGALQMAAGAVMATAASWTGIGAVAGVVLIANGAGTIAQGIGQVYNDVTNTNTLGEENMIREITVSAGESVAGDTGGDLAGIMYDSAVIAASAYGAIDSITQGLASLSCSSSSTATTFLPDEFYNQKAPKFSSPNSSYTKYRWNSHTGGFEKSTAYYDGAGRQIIRIDWTNHGRLNHGNPHVHYTTYSAQFRDGTTIRWD